MLYTYSMSEVQAQTPLRVPAREQARAHVHSDDLLRAFTAISRALNLDQPLSYTLDLIAEKVSQTLGHKYCAILLCHEETNELLIEGAYGLPEEYITALNTSLKQRVVGEGIMARSVSVQAFRTRLPVYIHDVAADRRFGPWREAAIKAGYRALVALPLVFRGQTIGVLNCYDEPRQYSEDQVEALMVVAEQTASAVGIARLVLEQQHTIEQLKALHHRATLQQYLLQRSEGIHDALTALLLNDCTLDDITTTLADLLEAPITLQDEHLHVLSWADRLPRRHVQLRADLHVSGQLAALRETGRAVRVEWEAGDGDRTCTLVAHVAGGQYDHAYLAMPLGAGDVEDAFYLRTLEQAASVYALYLIKQHVAHEAEARIRGDLLGDLLAGRFRDAAEVYERAQYLGLDVYSWSHRLLVLRPEALSSYVERSQRDQRAGHVHDKLLALARSFAGEGTHGGMATAIDDGFVLLLQAPEDAGLHRLAGQFCAAVRRAFPGLRVRVSVSARCTQPQDFAHHYQEALALAGLADRLAAPDPVICYDDWAFYGLLLRAGGQEDIDDLVHRVLDRLVVQDKSAQGELLATLQAYLDHNLSPKRTAAALHVHPNTVKYRLRQIAGLLNLTLANLDHVLAVKMALMVRAVDPERFDRQAASRTAL